MESGKVGVLLGMNNIFYAVLSGGHGKVQYTMTSNFKHFGTWALTGSLNKVPSLTDH